jgi:hypothetical protein
MARLSKLTVLQLGAPVPKGEDGIWAAIKRLDGEGRKWSVSDIDAELNMPRGAVVQYVRKLVAGKFAVRAGVVGGSRGATAKQFYRLKGKPPADAPRLKWNGEQAGPIPMQLMWRAMRSLSMFNVDELAFAASIDNYRVTRKAALDYTRLLARVGYLTDMGDERYRLKPSMNTGPHYPMRVSMTALFDRNKMQYVGEAEVGDEVLS